MAGEPSIWARLSEFIEALVPYGWIILTSGVGPAAIIALANKYKTRARFLKVLATPSARPWILMGIFIAGFGYASFSAFDDVNARLRKAQNEVKRPPLDPSMLYQDGFPAAYFGAIETDAKNNSISFNIITSSRELDMSKPFEFREWKLLCSGTADGMSTFGAARQIHYENVICKIQGER